MQLVKIISTSLDSLNRRLPKFLRLGLNDIQTANEASPFGIDSNPIAGMIAIYSKTAVKGDEVIIGYLNPNQIAGIGETRLFSTDSDGALQFYVWLKNDGTLQLGGTSNYAVKFNELKTEFNALKTSFNNLLTEYKTHTHPGVTSGGASTGPTVSTQNPNASNIDNAKNENILTL